MSTRADKPFLNTADDVDGSAVKSLRKALNILATVAAADRGLTIAEIAVLAGVPRPTAHRIIQTLQSEGYLEQGSIDGRFSIGFASLPLAASLLDRNRLRIEALPHLEQLAQRTNERVNLGILHRGRVLYLAGVEKPSLPTIYSRFGRSVPAHCSSLGKAILAHLPEADLAAVLQAHPLDRFTANTITDPVKLQEELATTRERGFATDHAEHAQGSYCIALPIFNSGNYPVGAIGLSARRIEGLLEEVGAAREAAELISHKL